MNKYKKALNEIIDKGITVDYFNEQAERPQNENTILMLVELVDKETPMKPLNQEVIDWGLGNAGDCKNCSREVNYQNKYCDNCGQQIDWSDTK